MAWALLQTMGSLLAVLTLMVVVLFFLKKWIYGSNAQTTSAIDIQIVGYKHLQPKRSIYVVDIDEKRLVVGVSEAGIQPLAEYPVKEPLDEKDSRTELGPSHTTQSFVDYLKENLGVVRPRVTRSRKPKNTEM
jgi:flagellar biosynthetic protein FliO